MRERGRQSILDEIAAGGPLQKIFQKAAGGQLGSARKLLARIATRSTAHLLTSQARHQVDRGASDSPMTEQRECAAGCSACCFTPLVELTPLEAIVAAEHLEREFAAEELEAIKPRLEENATRRKAALSQGRTDLRLACAMLGPDGFCRIYESRPLICAGVFSLSREACETASRADADEPGHIPIDRPAKAWTMGISGGLQRALVEAGLDGNLYELHSAVLRALDVKDAAGRWLAGEDIFAGCYCTDAHSPPRLPANVRLDDAESHRPKRGQVEQKVRG